MSAYDQKTTRDDDFGRDRKGVIPPTDIRTNPRDLLSRLGLVADARGDDARDDLAVLSLSRTAPDPRRDPKGRAEAWETTRIL